jgi:UDP-N-acetylenolpyruvoylglucosamine reductase
MNLQHNFSLKKYNSFGIDVTAKYFADFKTTEELQIAYLDHLLIIIQVPLFSAVVVIFSLLKISMGLF